MDATLLAETAEDLYENAPCGYLSMAPGGTIVRVNQTLLDWLGYAREQLLGRTFASLLTVGGRIYHETHYAPLLKMHGRVDQIAFDLVTSGDERRAVLVTTVARLDHAGAPAVYRSTIFDASERRSYERELVLARKAAERAAQERADFLSMVSHELRTPLTLALGSADERLAAPALGEADREAWQLVRRTGERMQKLVNTLLDFARIEAGQVQPRFRAVELPALTRELAEVYRPAIERAGLRLVDAIEPVGTAHVDREMWEKVVLNLLSNALKFTFTGELEIGLARRGADVELAVRDTGTGIPEAELPHVFEKFHRVRDARGRTREGTGIGLALVDELVRLHDGTVGVQSELGRGTTFRVRIPAERRDVDTRDTDADRAIALAQRGAFVDEGLHWSWADAEPAATSHDASRPRILVADDSADLRAFMASLLGNTYDVETIGDGTTALARARAVPPDLVIADVRMPGLDGQQLVRALRTEPRTRLVPVIVLSSGATEDARVSGIEAGADDYIVKPFSPRELRARVRTHLDLARLRTAAAHERERFRAAFESASVGLAIASLSGRFLQVNRAFCDITGYTEEELMQLGAVEITHSADRETTGALLADLVADRRDSAVLEKRYVRPDDATVWVQTSVALVRDVDGSPLHTLAICEDITARKQAEHDRNRLLAREQAARAQAEAAGRAKDEFLAMLGHELRNPLAPMVTALQLLQLRGQRSREFDVIGRQVRHLSRLVDDLLDVARITRGKVELRQRSLELSRVVTDALEIARPLIERRRQHLTVDVAETGLRVWGDPGRLAQVISNLVTNASKYSETATSIHIAAERAGGWITLRVRDQGVGISPDMRDRIFEMFIQQPQALDRSQGGLGLGLAIVRNLVHLHGGRVRVHSDGLGHGSEFVVELPEDTRALAAAPAPAPTAAPAARSNSRLVLIVDDNQDAADLLADAIRLGGHHVEVAYDGPSALARAAERPPDVALVDIGLPVMDGYEVAAKLAALTHARICMVSGYGQPSDRQRTTEAGIEMHLLKPVDLAAVMKFVEGPATAAR